MREIALDTETTGLSVTNGDKIVEIGCVEIVDKKITGNTYHTYVNPEREVSISATEISGLTYDFLKKFKKFPDICQEFLDFIGDSRLVIHNAPFDIGFLNSELSIANKQSIHSTRVVDTLIMAKEKFPGAHATLDALCNRFSVNRSSRTSHGALIDANLLAEVYIQMSVEVLQNGFFKAKDSSDIDISAEKNIKRKVFAPRNFQPSEAELLAHSNLLKKIKAPIWEKLQS